MTKIPYIYIYIFKVLKLIIKEIFFPILSVFSSPIFSINQIIKQFIQINSNKQKPTPPNQNLSPYITIITNQTTIFINLIKNKSKKGEKLLPSAGHRRAIYMCMGIFVFPHLYYQFYFIKLPF